MDNFCIELNDVSIERQKKLVWSQGTFKIKNNSIVAIIGPNGCGKTTLVELLLGILKPTTGKIRVLKKSPGKANNKIGYVPQKYSLFSLSHISVYESIKLHITGTKFGFQKNTKDIDKKIKKALESVGMLEFADTRIAELSGGQIQKVCIANAIVDDPEILILDEPFANLDIKNQKMISQLIKKINKERKITILIVTHDLNPLINILTAAIYLLDGHTHYDTIGNVVNKDLLSHMYGENIKIYKTLQGDIFIKPEE